MAHPVRIIFGIAGIFGLAGLVFGGLWMANRPSAKATAVASTRIGGALEVLHSTKSPELSFDLLDLYLRGGRMELVAPEAALPRFHKLSTSAVRALHAYASTCDVTKAQENLDPALAKAWLWTRHVCDPQFALPEDFFRTPPLMHPGGRSYVALALAQAGRIPRYDQAWRKEHLHLLHVTELSKLGALAEETDAVRRLLASLARPVLAALVANQPAVVAGERYFLYRRAGSGARAADGGEYRVYSAAVWNDLNEPFMLVERHPETLCQYGDGIFCWVARPDGRGSLYAGLAIAALIGLSMTLAVLAVSRIRVQRRDREDQLFVLRTLTHELRTPAAGIALTLETLRDDFDRLPETSQSAFLGLCDEVQRLSRVITASTRYLRVHGPRERFSVTRLDSLRDYLEAVLEPYSGRVRVVLPASDRAFSTDPYWLKVCLCNLIDNALLHGLPEVSVVCDLTPDALTVDVADRGAIKDHDIEALARSTSRREDGRGLGLGLGIVLRTVRDVGGSLTLKSSPTTFSLRWKEGR